MENAITAGLSKQIVLARALETTANNIANQSTAGFKADRVLFREYVARLDQSSGDPSVSLVFDPESYVDFSPGAIEPTYADFDFAIDGDGFFTVETGAGVRYTRDGRFQLNEFGELTTRTGARILDAGGAPLIIDPDNGPVILSIEGELQQAGATIGFLSVARFSDPSVLRKAGDNLFAASQGPIDAPRGRIRQGFIETANVQPIAAVTDMIEIMRAYEQAARVIETSDELARRAIATLTGQN